MLRGITLFTLYSYIITVVQGYMQCQDTQCYGTGAYCCGPFDDECCWETVYSHWWIWFLWFWFAFFIVTCVVCICVRRRRRRLAHPYMVVDGQPTYGSVPTYNSTLPAYNVGSTLPPDYNYPQIARVHQGPTAPAYQEKPPDYSTIAGAR